MNYSTTGFQLVLTRKMSFYVVTYYLPSGLFVVVSWIRSASCVCHHPDTFLLTTQWMKEIADNKIDSKCNEILPSLTENSDGGFFSEFPSYLLDFNLSCLCFELCHRATCGLLSAGRQSHFILILFNFQFSREPRNYPGPDDAAGDYFPRADQHSQHDTDKQSQGKDNVTLTVTAMQCGQTFHE